MSDQALSSPTIDQFAEELVKEPRWYDLGVFLGVPTHELDTIGLNYRQDGTIRCLIEMYKCLESRKEMRSWNDIAQALSRINNAYLSHHIQQKYLGIISPKPKAPPSPELTILVEKKITSEFKEVISAFNKLKLEVKTALRDKGTRVQDIHLVVMEFCEIEEMTEKELTIDGLFIKLHQHYCFLNYHVLIELVKSFFNENEQLKKCIKTYEQQLDKIKETTELKDLMKQINEKRVPDRNQKIVKLEIQEFWGKVLIKKFEIFLKHIFKQTYKALSNIRVEGGCISISWLISETYIVDLVKVADSSHVLLKAVGVISITVGNDVLYSGYSIGCEVIESALIQAVTHGNSTAAEILVSVGGNVNTNLYNGNTPVVIAIYKGHVEIVQLLLRNNVNINATSKSGKTAIFIASICGHTDVVSLLLEAGADPNIPANEGHTPLMAASERGHVETVWLLLKANVNINATTKSGQTAIFAASIRGHTDVVSLLLDSGADPNTPDNKGHTPLTAASQEGHVEIVWLLLKANVNINATTKSGQTALFAARIRGHTDVVSLLLDSGTDPNTPDNKGHTPLTAASQEGHVEIVRLLLKANVNISTTTTRGQTAIFAASIRGHTDVVSLLLDSGADPNTPDNKVHTPLMQASGRGHVEIVRLLLKANVNINATSKSGQTAIYKASKSGHTDVVSLLLDSGADFNTTDNILFKDMLLQKYKHKQMTMTSHQRTLSLVSVTTLDSATTADTGIYSQDKRDSDDDRDSIDSKDILLSDED